MTDVRNGPSGPLVAVPTVPLEPGDVATDGASDGDVLTVVAGVADWAPPPGIEPPIPVADLEPGDDGDVLTTVAGAPAWAAPFVGVAQCQPSYFGAWSVAAGATVPLVLNANLPDPFDGDPFSGCVAGFYDDPGDAAGLVIVGGSVLADTFRLYVFNPTSAQIDASSKTFTVFYPRAAP